MKVIAYHILTAALVLAVLFGLISPAQAGVQPQAHAPESAEPRPLVRDELGAFLDELMLAEMEALNLPNAAIAVVSGGEVLFLKGYGASDLESGLPVDPERTLFRIGSISKLATWTAVMQLVEQGQLDLHQDVNSYLDFTLSDRRLQGPEPVTLWHLLTHTPGFEAYPDAIFRLSPEHLLPLQRYVKEQMPERVYPPGQVAAYSNYGAALAGYIVERISGMPFAEYAERNIFAPLGMQHSTFRQPAPGQPPAALLPPGADLARPYRYTNGAFLAGEIEYMQEPEGSLSSTAADMAKFMLAHLPGSRGGAAGLLQADTLHQMHSPQPTRHPDLGGMALGFMHGAYNGRPTLFHGGSTMLFDSGLYLLPEENTGIFITYSGANHLLHSRIFQSFMDHYYPAPQASAPAVPAGMRARSLPFAGEYHQNTRSFTTAEAFTSLTLGVIQVQVDEEGYLLVTHENETSRFVEIEPGVYRSLRQSPGPDYFGPFRTLVFEPGPLGQTLLLADGPMSYSRAPWYATSTFTLLGLGLTLLLAVVSLAGWTLAALIRLARRSPKGTLLPGQAAARTLGASFAALALVFVASSLVTGLPDPLYLLPAAAYGVQPAWNGLLLALPWLVAGLGLALMVITIPGWARWGWKLPTRLHFSALSAAAAFLMFVFYYWNLL